VGETSPEGETAAALGCHSDATRARLCFHVQQDSYNTQTLIRVLEQLAGFYAGQRVVLLWDGLSAHWSHDMRAWLQTQRHWLTVWSGCLRMRPSSTRWSTCGPTSRGWS
jgi:hypothetical protein